MEAPRITIYYRILSNVDETPVTNFMFIDSTKDLTLNYGHIDPTKGGESPYIIEFDIWNNEPAFAAGMLPDRVKDAKNCTFEVWDNANLNSMNNLIKDKKMFVHARCITKTRNSKWLPIAGAYVSLDKDGIFGNVDKTNEGVLSGQPGGDHTIIQTKLVLPELVGYNKNFNFVFNFGYDYD
ncbi:gp173 [Bacillus phage G]|uniref:Gp173 n=1 Tax=Bacillus phage G TaxID=2884420 RepID=G3MBN9_9CAUD|nr:gp173 [Bacillus phage G]AEO93433.1 gp173 [Bacillus phage G]